MSMIEAIEAILDIFSKLTITVEDPSPQALARTIAQDQGKHYQRILGAIAQLPYLDETGGVKKTSATSNELQRLGDWCTTVLRGNAPTDLQHEGKFKVRSILPVLTEKSVQRLIAALPDDENPAENLSDANFLQNLLIGAVVTEAARHAEAPINRNYDIESFRFQAAVATYLSVREIFRNRSINLESFESRVTSAVGLAENAKANLDKSMADFRNRLDSLLKAEEDIREKNRRNDEAANTLRARLADFEQSIRAEMGLNQVRQHWHQRFREARLQFYISCGLLIAITVAVVIFAVVEGEDILDRVNHVNIWQLLIGGSAASAIAIQAGRLLVISVPVLAIFWMIRVLIRYFMRSMLLMDDARQRQTMLDTYFLLTEQGRADENDRPLILWALFRQTPGHGNDGIEPPDFTEVINAGFNRARATD